MESRDGAEVDLAWWHTRCCSGTPTPSPSRDYIFPGSAPTYNSYNWCTPPSLGRKVPTHQNLDVRIVRNTRPEG
jgi:hypothetical protein